jgi:hypothetical protein
MFCILQALFSLIQIKIETSPKSSLEKAWEMQQAPVLDMLPSGAPPSLATRSSGGEQGALQQHGGSPDRERLCDSVGGGQRQAVLGQ